jgi:hypothetical protein
MNDDPETLELLELICRVEDFLLSTGDLRSDFTFIVCRNKDVVSPSAYTSTVIPS